jgi:phosphatidylglycerol:prolipoprotein diacylglycerol transferase
MLLLARSERRRCHAGALTGCFLIGYGIARSTGECFREPDAFLGFLFQGLTMGQLLCIPMILAGIGLLIYAYRSRPMQVKPV